jgi:hypothetical protein
MDIKTVIMVRNQETSTLSLVNVTLKEFINNESDRLIVACDEAENRYQKTDEFLNYFGWPEEIWVKKIMP